MKNTREHKCHKIVHLVEHKIFTGFWSTSKKFIYSLTFKNAVSVEGSGTADSQSCVSFPKDLTSFSQADCEKKNASGLRCKFKDINKMSMGSVFWMSE